MLDTSITSPLPVSDLYRLHLTYQAFTPASSNASESSEDLDSTLPLYPAPPDYQPYHHYHQPQPRSFPYPPNVSQHHEHPYLKNEYDRQCDMADVPFMPSQDLAAKVEYSEDGRLGKMEMDQEEVDAIIRNKRKVRDPKACYACHRRKVKCDRNLPCDSCVKRDHPELCSYERPTKKRRIALSNALTEAAGGRQETADRIVNSGPNITVPKEQWERLNQKLAQYEAHAREDKDDGVSGATEEHSSAGLLSHSDEGDREGVHAPSSQMGTMHLGSRSVLAYMIGNRSKSTRDTAMSLLTENILPNLGLDNENTTYPFVDLWSTDSSMQDVSGLVKALPEDSLCHEFWLTYRDIPCTIYPVVPDAEAFNSTLVYLLDTRREIARTGADIDPDRPYGVSLPWLALLFAVLASGSQSTGRPAKERELTSQVYICCSYQALRMSNFLTHPSLETIEALLIIGNALSYNMNPGVSYIILGMTLRSAFSMGLHVQSKEFSEHETYLRSRIWWALAWQDSHFSVSYDRPSSSMLCTPDVPHTKHSTPGTRSYVESMSSIISLTQEILRERSMNNKSPTSWASITKYKDEVHRIWEDAQLMLRTRTKCVAMTDHLERLALQLHCSYMISEICRPALKEDPNPTPTSHSVGLPGKQASLVSPGASGRKSSVSSGSPNSTSGDPLLTYQLRAECIKHLEKCVDTYIELRSINKFAARSWIGIQRSISAAFLLGVLPETRQEPRIIKLLTELEQGIAQSAFEDTGFAGDRDQKSPTRSGTMRLSMTDAASKDSPVWVRSMTKSLNALSNLNAALASDRKGQSNQHFSASKSCPPNPHAQAAAMYNTSIISPGGRHHVTNLPINPQQYPNVYNTIGRPVPGMALHAGHPMPPNMGPYMADNNGDSWNYGNMRERALEHVHPGIWG